MNKKTLIIVIILIIITGIICGIAFSKNSNKTIPANTNTEKLKENITTNEEINNITNELKTNTTEENNIAENTQTTNNTEQPQETQKTDQQKAIEIVKKDYKTSLNVEFSAEGLDTNGNQIVVVRKPETTESLAFYFVNVSNSTFTKKEIN